MSYSVRPNSKNPVAVLFVVDQSGSMEDKMASGRFTKAQQVANVINKTINDMVVTCSQDTFKQYYDIGVIGYGDGGAYNALGGAFSGNILNSVEVFYNNPLRVEDRMTEIPTPAGDIVETTIKFPVWFDPKAYGGTPMKEALELAAQTIAPWCDAHLRSFPPVVIHISDGEWNGGDPTGIAEGIKTLFTNDGNVLLCNLHVSTEKNASISFPDTDAVLPNSYAKALFGMSSVIPEEMRTAVEAELRGKVQITPSTRFFTFNGDEAAVVRFIRVGTLGSLPKLPYNGAR